MSPFTTRGKSYLSCSIIAILSTVAACRSNRSADNEKAQKKSDTLVSTVVTGKNASVDTGDYKLFQSFQPQIFWGNKQITIEILQDKRLNGLGAKVYYYPDLHAAQLMFNSDQDMLNPDGPEYKPAILLITNSKGTTLSRKILDVPCARIDTVYLDENKTRLTYLFTEDYSTGIGSYSGPLTYFVHFVDTGIVKYNTYNGFATTLKSGWAMYYTEKGLEVWSKICRPTDNDDFNIITKKSTLYSDSFRSIINVKKGFWENEGDSSSRTSLKYFLDNFSD